MKEKLTYIDLLGILERNGYSLEQTLLALSHYFYTVAMWNDMESGKITEIRFQGNLNTISEEILSKCQSDWWMEDAHFYELTISNRLIFLNHANEEVAPKLIFIIVADKGVSNENQQS